MLLQLGHRTIDSNFEIFILQLFPGRILQAKVIRGGNRQGYYIEL